MLKIKKGDYFDLYQDGQPARRVIAMMDSIENDVIAGEIICEDMGFVLHPIDIKFEVEKVIGNIYNDN